MACWDSPTIVFFDLETTGLCVKRCHITQLGASYEDYNFDQYILPRIPIQEKASELTGMTVSGGRLFVYGQRVKTVFVYRALKSFINFLGDFHGPVLLAAHNSRRFDELVLMRLLAKFSLFKRFKKVVSGFVDTLLLSKDDEDIWNVTKWI
ncbi:uncharacterized protein LOC134883770 isoform X2 [Eleginops maclovinus]|uniref:uncharacterized protein LOC134883770 isoform X2 n=1 Tax=Eleginops maclovinus TaxID=56733 RepID=UPI00307FED00